MRALLLSLLFLTTSLSAGFLPLVHDRPRRDNPNDPAVKAQSLPLAPVWTPTATATATPVPASCGTADASGPGITTVGNFEAGADGFSQDTCCTGFIPNGAAASSTHCNGSQALCGTSTFTHAGTFKQTVVKKSISPVGNWAGKTIKAWARFDPGMQAMSAQLYIKSNGFNYSNGPIFNAPAAGGWIEISFDLSQTPNYVGSVTNTATVSEFGYQIYSNAGDPDGTYSFCLDDVRVE